MAIKTFEQAVSVQKRRHEAGKRGTSKAVRRYLKRVHGTFPAAFGDSFPVRW